jgi:hypothetical protein
VLPTLLEPPSATARLAPAPAGLSPSGAAGPPADLAPVSWPSWPAGAPSPFERPSFGRVSAAAPGPSPQPPGAPVPRAKLARDLQSASTLSLVWAGLGIFSFLFPLAIVGIVLGVRAHRLGRQLHAAVPIRATLGIAVGLLGCLTSVVAMLAGGLVALGYFIEDARDTRIATLQKSLGDKASAPLLDPAAACAMAEIHLLRTGHDGHPTTAMEAFRCAGTLAQTKERAQLPGVSFSAGGDEYSLNACFVRGAAWSVSELRKDPCPVPPTPAAAPK